MPRISMSGFSDETPPGLPTSQMGSMEDRVVPRVLEGPCVFFSPRAPYLRVDVGEGSQKTHSKKNLQEGLN